MTGKVLGACGAENLYRMPELTTFHYYFLELQTIYGLL